METTEVTAPKWADFRLILTGVVLGALFWIFESAAHFIFFRDADSIQEVLYPPPHEMWMRLTVIGMFVGFSIYSQMLVSARRRAEEDAMRVNAELCQIFDTAADGMRLIDKDFGVLRANETFSRLSGMSKEEVTSKRCYEVFSGPLCHTDGCPVTRILDDGGPIRYDTEKIRKDGSIVPCTVTATPLKEPGGATIGIVEDFKDISEWRRFEQELLQSRERIRVLAAHLQVVVEEERKHLAREIHDELGQALTALKMDIHWLSRRLPSENRMLIEKTEAMAEVVNRTIKSVKRISSELRPGLLDDLGLTAAIECQAEEFSQRTGIRCDILSEPEDIVLDQEHSIALFRIFQEAMTNIARHAGASSVEVFIKGGRGRVEMRIRDDGRGIEKSQISASKSYGITGMVERAHALGGELRIEGVENRGTTVEVTMPIGM